MSASKWLSRVVVLAILCVAVTPAVVLSLPSGAPDKLEPDLRVALMEGGTSELIIEFTQQADLSAAYGMDWEARGRYVYETLQAVARQVQAPAIAVADRLGLQHQTFIAGNELYVWGAGLAATLDLAQLPNVAAVRAPRVYYLDPIVPTAPSTEATLTWGLADTNATQFWASYGQGTGILVANIDTGVQYDHPALINQYKCADNPTSPVCWLDPANICRGDVCDNNGHGTHTMGTMVAANDAALPYTAGMAPGAEWIACKGCERRSCSDASLNACADWVLAPGGNTANRPHVVNNSWGGGGGDAWYQGKVNAWRAAGIFPAFSAGNNGPGCSTLGSPGDYQQSFASAAHASSGAIASFSSRGPSAFGHEPYTKPNISAPGASVISTYPTNTWASMSGTSMASPHTAGAVALLWSCNASLVGQIDQTFQILQGNTDASPAGDCGAPPDGEGNYTFGYGYLNVLQAGNAVCGAPVQPPAAPSNLVASAVSSSQINLTWVDNANNESGFEIERCTGAGCGDFGQIATVGANATAYPDAGLAPDTTYTYRVRAYNAGGLSGYSNLASATTQAGPSGVLHVSDIAMTAEKLNKVQYRITANITIVDEGGQAAEGATVYATWTLPNGKTSSGSATTGADGVATLSLVGKAGTYQICVDDVAKPGYTYDEGQNAETCDGVPTP